MKYILLLSMFLSFNQAYAEGPKACFVKFDGKEGHFSGFGPKHLAIKLAMGDCYSYARKNDEDYRKCKLAKCFDYKTPGKNAK